MDNPSRPESSCASWSPPRRFLPKCVVGLFLFGVALTALSWLLGLSVPWPDRAPTGGVPFGNLGIAALFAAVSILAWEIVERGGKKASLLAWLAFPFSFLLAFAQLPFLALAIYPPLEEQFTSAGRVEAYFLQRPAGRFFEISFPHPMEMSDCGNLRFDATGLPRTYYERHRGRFCWSGERTLAIDIDPIIADLELGKITTVAVNAEITSRPFHYASGDRVPPQTVRVRSE